MFSDSLTNMGIVLHCSSQKKKSTSPNNVTRCALRITGWYEFDIISLKMSVTHYELAVICSFILHLHEYLVSKSRTQRQRHPLITNDITFLAITKAFLIVNEVCMRRVPAGRDTHIMMSVKMCRLTNFQNNVRAVCHIGND